MKNNKTAFTQGWKVYYQQVVMEYGENEGKDVSSNISNILISYHINILLLFIKPKLHFHFRAIDAFEVIYPPRCSW